MIILGVDQSFTSTGWTIIDESEEVLEFGIIGTSKDDGDVFTRARIIVDKLNEIITSYPIDYIGIEGLAFGGQGNATRDLAGLQFMIIDSLRPRIIDITAPTAVKRLAVNGRKGKIEKKDLFEALPENIQKLFLERGLKKTRGLFDVTDSYWIGVCTLRKYNV